MIVLAWAASPAARAESAPVSPEPLPPGLSHRRDAQGELFDAVLPGPVVSALVVPKPDGESTLFLLSRPAGQVDGPRSLYRLSLGGEGRLERLREGLPEAGKALAALDLDGDGVPELLLGTLGQLYSLGRIDRLDEGKPLVTLLDRPDFDLRSTEPQSLRVARADRPWLAAAEAGTLRLYRADGKGGLALWTRFDLPVSAHREATGLALVSPPVVPLEAAGQAGASFAVGPEEHGKRRLRSVLLRTEAGGEPALRSESWGLLPGLETVEQSWILEIGGKPVLFVAAQSAAELSLFENQQLRVFPWREDRTRGGKPPLLAYATPFERWHDLDLTATDLDGDGREDLILLCPKGLLGKELGLEMLPGLGGGRFLAKPRRSSVDPVPELYRFVADVDGDQVPDFVAFDGGVLALYPGARRGDRVIEKKPSASVALPSPGRAGKRSVTVSAGTSGAEARSQATPGYQEIEALDLDHDGRREVLLLGTAEGEAGRLLIWKPPAPRP